MAYEYVNEAVFTVRSLTYHHSRHINIEKFTRSCTTVLQKPKFKNFYQMDKLWWELYNRECGEGLADVKSEGADTEKVWCAGAWHIQDNPRLCFIVESFIYKIHLIVPVHDITLIVVFISLMFWVSHLINQNTATTFCIIRKYLLFCKTLQLAPPKRAHWNTYQLMSQCCPLLLRYPRHYSCTDITFVCIHLYEWNWDCYGLRVMECGGSADQ